MACCGAKVVVILQCKSSVGLSHIDTVVQVKEILFSSSDGIDQMVD